mmetsp:Transcript_120914/g.341964  ORF Transcript_120914/g.341964 Transcript_120914/m.341964 type:complete len:320 (+) Transcript_120914:3454-4413(+)
MVVNFQETTDFVNVDVDDRRRQVLYPSEHSLQLSFAISQACELLEHLGHGLFVVYCGLLAHISQRNPLAILKLANRAQFRVREHGRPEGLLLVEDANFSESLACCCILGTADDPGWWHDLACLPITHTVTICTVTKQKQNAVVFRVRALVLHVFREHVRLLPRTRLLPFDIEMRLDARPCSDGGLCVNAPLAHVHALPAPLQQVPQPSQRTNVVLEFLGCDHIVLVGVDQQGLLLAEAEVAAHVFELVRIKLARPVGIETREGAPNFFFGRGDAPLHALKIQLSFGKTMALETGTALPHPIMQRVAGASLVWIQIFARS